MTTQQEPGHVDVLIIGAGVSGIGIACRLRAELPGRSLAILERRQDLGGTWDLFRYPGIRSDSDMFSFAYQFQPWSDARILADAGSIKEYVGRAAREHGIDELISYGLRVTRADWSSASATWAVTAVDEATGVEQVWTCDFLATCTGYYDYDQGFRPEFPGEAAYQGTWVHPQHWPEDLDYTGKQVVVIGSGATAVTVVPAMAETAAHVTMLQRSPSYLIAMPQDDKIVRFMLRFLPDATVYRFTRWRAILFQRVTFRACRRWPRATRALLLRLVRGRLGKDYDLSHFTPRYNPWDERLCAVLEGDLFDALIEGRASMSTDTIETFTPTGIRLSSGRELEADVVVTATGLNMQMLGGAELVVDGVRRDIQDVLTYKSVLLEGVPNLLWVFGYTNSSWTLKVDIAAQYLVRLLRHLDATGNAIAVPIDRHDNANGDGIIDELNSGYVQRGKHAMPRQGREHPWRVLMDYQHDSRVLLTEPIDDGVLEISPAPVARRAVS